MPRLQYPAVEVLWESGEIMQKIKKAFITGISGQDGACLAVVVGRTLRWMHEA